MTGGKRCSNWSESLRDREGWGNERSARDGVPCPWPHEAQTEAAQPLLVALLAWGGADCEPPRFGFLASGCTHAKHFLDTGAADPSPRVNASGRLPAITSNQPCVRWARTASPAMPTVSGPWGRGTRVIPEYPLHRKILGPSSL
jgi:hypothetical protein